MYNIGEFSALTGLTQRALRFYESKSLLCPAKEQFNQYRIYSGQDLEKALKIQFFKQLGFSLDEIREILNLTEFSDLIVLEKKLKDQIQKFSNEISHLKDQKSSLIDTIEFLRNSQIITLDDLNKIKSLNFNKRRKIMQTLRLESSSQSIIGNREVNEDNFLIKEGKANNLYIIADGFGGRDNISASKIACNIIKNNINLLGLDENNYRQDLTELINLASKEILIEKNKNDVPSGKENMGTTLSILVIKQQKAYIAHVGETRIYRFRNNNLTQLTKDHTQIQRLIEQGEILKKDIHNHSEKNVIYSCLGFEENVKEIFFLKEEVLPEDSFLLMTDGVHDILSDSEILEILKKSANIKVAEKTITELINKHGSDNATILFVYPNHHELDNIQ